jgi:hypothetical protein
VISPWQGRYLHRITQTQHSQTSMPWVGLEPTIPAFEQAKTVHAIDRASTVISEFRFYVPEKMIVVLWQCLPNRSWLLIGNTSCLA